MSKVALTVMSKYVFSIKQKQLMWVTRMRKESVDVFGDPIMSMNFIRIDGKLIPYSEAWGIVEYPDKKSNWEDAIEIGIAPHNDVIRLRGIGAYRALDDAIRNRFLGDTISSIEQVIPEHWMQHIKDNTNWGWTEAEYLEYDKKLLNKENK